MANGAGPRGGAEGGGGRAPGVVGVSPYEICPGRDDEGGWVLQRSPQHLSLYPGCCGNSQCSLLGFQNADSRKSRLFLALTLNLEPHVMLDVDSLTIDGTAWLLIRSQRSTLLRVGSDGARCLLSGRVALLCTIRGKTFLCHSSIYPLLLRYLNAS